MFEVLDSEILSFIRRYGTRKAPDSAFNSLALRIFDAQFKHNAPYRQWCLNEGKSPSNVTNWKDIPAVPARAFKRLRLACFPKSAECRVFQTSGTTVYRTTSRGETLEVGKRTANVSPRDVVRGRHYFDTLKLYEAAIQEPFKKHFLGDGAKLSYFFLMPSPMEAKDSSLSYMMGVIQRVFAKNKGHFFVRKGVPQYEALYHRLSHEKEKVFLLSTAFALKGFFDFMEAHNRTLKLATGSRIMETGGFKGRAQEISKKALYRLCQKNLGIPPRRIVSEYGMTELSSQYYDGQAPAWLRTVIVDPRTGKEAARGGAGLLRHIDLANRGSVIAVETEDLGRRRSGGFEFIGRAKHSDLRGCSLAFEEFLAR